MSSLATLLLDKIRLRVPNYLYTYVEGKTPLSTPKEVYTTLASYLFIVFSIQAVMKTQKKPLKLTRLFRLHNILLTSGSFILLSLMLEEVVPMVWKHGLHFGVCSEKAWTPKLEFYYIINYYFKYWELVDTVFLALKKKPLQFLHVFHHSATALLCYTQLNGKTSSSWFVISLNLAIHVVMYYYYYATAGGARFWWKKYLTTMQITQFVLDLAIVYFVAYERVASKYLPDLPHISNCAGSGEAISYGVTLLTSYLGLFINFYFQTYKKPASNMGRSTMNGTT